MKQVTIALAVSLAAFGLTGCQSLTETPYYKTWHDQAYGMRAVRQNQYNVVSYQRQAPNPSYNNLQGGHVQSAYPNDIIPVPMNAPMMNAPVNVPAVAPMRNSSANVDMGNYYVDDNPYQSYSPQTTY